MLEWRHRKGYEPRPAMPSIFDARPCSPLVRAHSHAPLASFLPAGMQEVDKQAVHKHSPFAALPMHAVGPDHAPLVWPWATQGHIDRPMMAIDRGADGRAIRPRTALPTTQSREETSSGPASVGNDNRVVGMQIPLRQFAAAPRRHRRRSRSSLTCAER